MKLSFLLVVIAAIMALVATKSQSHVEARDIKTYMAQQPLLFGRRGFNPNMNSLFFGKKSGIDSSSTSVRELKNACSMIMTYLDEIDNIVSDRE